MAGLRRYYFPTHNLDSWLSSQSTSLVLFRYLVPSANLPGTVYQHDNWALPAISNTNNSTYVSYSGSPEWIGSTAIDFSCLFISAFCGDRLAKQDDAHYRATFQSIIRRRGRLWHPCRHSCCRCSWQTVLARRRIEVEGTVKPSIII